MKSNFGKIIIWDRKHYVVEGYNQNLELYIVRHYARGFRCFAPADVVEV